MPLTVVLHLREQERLLLLGETVLEFLITVCSDKDDRQVITDAAGLHIVVSIDIQPVIILSGADMRTEHFVCVEDYVHIELQQIIVLHDLLGEGDVL